MKDEVLPSVHFDAVLVAVGQVAFNPVAVVDHVNPGSTGNHVAAIGGAGVVLHQAGIRHLDAVAVVRAHGAVDDCAFAACHDSVQIRIGGAVLDRASSAGTDAVSRIGDSGTAEHAAIHANRDTAVAASGSGAVDDGTPVARRDAEAPAR